MASHVNVGLLVLQGKDQDIVLAAVILYVNDLHIIASKSLIGQIKNQMTKRFWMHDLRSVSCSLCKNLERNREHHTIDINEHSFIQMMLTKSRMDESRSDATPMTMQIRK
jgi:hypothetical protein